MLQLAQYSETTTADSALEATPCTWLATVRQQGGNSCVEYSAVTRFLVCLARFGTTTKQKEQL